MLFSSAGLTLFHMLLGTTPCIAPPSSLNKPVLIVCNFMGNYLKFKCKKGICCEEENYAE
jgi:hypothetical protein